MQPYTPDVLPLVNLDYQLLLPLVGQSNAALARYDGLLQGIQTATRSQYSVHVLDAIFNKPIFRSSDLTAQLFREFGVHEKTTPVCFGR